MRMLLIVLVLAGLTALSFRMGQEPTVEPAMKKKDILTGSFSPVAVLELFTSEGCSSCPPADRLLQELAGTDSAIFPLSFHVDYWNRLGWVDPFSSPLYSERQRDYARQLQLETIYTPQLVVNGKYELIGSNRIKAESVIKKILKENSTVMLTVEEVQYSRGMLHFSVHPHGKLNMTNVLAALVQKKITMNVRAGENNGAKLSHINVVREFLIQTAADKNEFEIKLPADLSNNNWQLIVYTQQKNTLQITGAAVYQPNF